MLLLRLVLRNMLYSTDSGSKASSPAPPADWRDLESMRSNSLGSMSPYSDLSSSPDGNTELLSLVLPLSLFIFGRRREGPPGVVVLVSSAGCESGPAPPVASPGRPMKGSAVDVDSEAIGLGWVGSNTNKRSDWLSP